jgi:hypothetical protein
LALTRLPPRATRAASAGGEEATANMILLFEGGCAVVCDACCYGRPPITFGAKK